MYEVVTNDEVARQVGALPDDLLSHYLRVLDLLELAPWSGEPCPEGRAEVIYLVLERDHRVELLRVHWVA